MNCCLCSFRAVSKANLSFHLNAVHFRDRDFVCRLCHFKTAYKGALTRHVNSVHLRTGNIKDCPICPYNTPSLLTLNSHLNSTHYLDIAMAFTRPMDSHNPSHSSSPNNLTSPHVNPLGSINPPPGGKERQRVGSAGGGGGGLNKKGAKKQLPQMAAANTANSKKRSSTLSIFSTSQSSPVKRVTLGIDQVARNLWGVASSTSNVIASSSPSSNNNNMENLCWNTSPKSPTMIGSPAFLSPIDGLRQPPPPPPNNGSGGGEEERQFTRHLTYEPSCDGGGRDSDDVALDMALPKNGGAAAVKIDNTQHLSAVQTEPMNMSMSSSLEDTVLHDHSGGSMSNSISNSALFVRKRFSVSSTNSSESSSGSNSSHSTSSSPTEFNGNGPPQFNSSSNLIPSAAQRMAPADLILFDGSSNGMMTSKMFGMQPQQQSPPTSMSNHHHVTAIGCVNCRLCNFVTVNDVELREHIRREHLHQIRTLACRLCEFTSNSKRDMNFHCEVSHKLSHSNSVGTTSVSCLPSNNLSPLFTA